MLRLLRHLIQSASLFACLDDRSDWLYRRFLSEIDLPNDSIPGEYEWRKFGGEENRLFRLYVSKLGKGEFVDIYVSDNEFGHKLVYDTSFNGFKLAQRYLFKKKGIKCKPRPGLNAKPGRRGKKADLGDNYFEPDLIADGVVNLVELNKRSGYRLRAAQKRVEKRITARLRDIDSHFKYAEDLFGKNADPADIDNELAGGWILQAIEMAWDTLIPLWFRPTLLVACDCGCEHSFAVRLPGDDLKHFDFLEYPPFKKLVREMTARDRVSSWLKTRPEFTVLTEGRTTSLSSDCQLARFKCYLKQIGKLHGLQRFEFVLVNNDDARQIRELLNSVGSSRSVRVKTGADIQALFNDIQRALFDRYLGQFREVTFDVLPTPADSAFKKALFKLVDRDIIRRSIATGVLRAYANQGGRLFSPANFKSDSVRVKLVEAGVIEKHPEFFGVWLPSAAIRRHDPVLEPAMQNAALSLLDVHIGDARSKQRGAA